MGKILFFGEPLIRITPQQFDVLHDGINASIHYGGSEVNVACALQGFGLQTRLLTGLPKNRLGDSYLSFLQHHAIDTREICRIGKRIGVYYLESGFGCRQGEVTYDRMDTSVSEITIDMLDLDSLFEGVSHFHFSGISIAISQNCRELLEQLLIEARKRQIIVSFDPNLRQHMIKLHDAKKEFSHFATYADYCFGIEPLMLDSQDFTLFDRENATLEELEHRMKDLKKKFQFKAIFHTIRETDGAGINHYQAFAFDGTLHASQTFSTKVLQRIGSGDAFVAGALYQLIAGASMSKTINFAVAAGSFKCTVAGDYLHHPAEQIDKLFTQSKDISR